MDKKKELVSEKYLVECVIDFLRNQGFKMKIEVPNMGRSIDVVATRGSDITAIEAKLNKWRQGLIQCDSHRLVADFIVLATAHKKAPEQLIRDGGAKGYGIIRCDLESKECTWELEPIKNDRIWKPQRTEFIEKMGAVPYAT